MISMFAMVEINGCILNLAMKKPAIMEAVALNFADNTDAKLQTFTELMDNTTETG